MSNFTWTNFYQELADKILTYKDKRFELIQLVEKSYNDAGQKYGFFWNDQYFTQIDPFTLFGSFNKGISEKNRIALIAQYKEKLGVQADIPSDFNGIPVLNNLKAWFCDDKEEDKMETLWDLFEAAIKIDGGDDSCENQFAELFDKAKGFKGVSWNLTMALYWIRPFTFINLDANNRNKLIDEDLYHGGFPSGKEYLLLCKELQSKENTDDFPYESFPEFSYQSWSADKPEQLSQAEFIKWFGPLIQALKDLGGSATPKDVRKRIIENEHLTDEEINATRGETNQNKFNNEVGWARLYLCKAGYIDGSTRGVWTLTKKGESVDITPSIATDILKNNHGNKEDDNNALADNGVDKKRYWIYSPGPNAFKWNEYYSKGIMGIGWSKIGDITQYKSKNEIKTALKENLDPTRPYTMDAHALWQFAYEMKPGDVIFVKKGMYKVIGRGVVTSDYEYDSSATDGYPNIRKVKWTDNGEWEHPGQAVMKTLTDITRYTDYVLKLKDLFNNEDEEDEEEEIEVKYDTYNKRNFLNDVFMDEESYDTLVDLLREKKNVILQGAPGVGKTYIAKRLAYSIIGSKDQNRVMMIQFHQSYSYEDFIEGLRPSKTGTNFEIKRGAFLDFCDRAREDDEENGYFFIIDEINRGNLSKIFGELFMLIEKDKRDNELQLLYSGDKFSVPKNVYIIGMMNTADRSLALLDYALRRRFAFYEIKPGFNSDGFKKYSDSLNNVKFNKLIQCVERLNEAIKEDDSLGEGFCIGHSYFCDKKEANDKTLSSIVEYELIPLLKEYWFDDNDKVRDWSERLRNSIK